MEFKENNMYSVIDIDNENEEIVKDNGEWETIQPKKQNPRKVVQKELIKNLEKDMHNENQEMPVLEFIHKWKVYVHKTDSDKWDSDSFDNDFYVIGSVGDFLKFFNNFKNFDLRRYSFFIMKSIDGDKFIEPNWEHEKNVNGSTYSIRVDVSFGPELLIQLCYLMVNEKLVSDTDNINGISFSTKTNWALIKIWTEDCKIDISKQLPSNILNGYRNLSLRAKENKQ